MRSLTSQLYRAARISATGRAIRTGHVARRARNIVIGRTAVKKVYKGKH